MNMKIIITAEPWLMDNGKINLRITIKDDIDFSVDTVIERDFFDNQSYFDLTIKKMCSILQDVKKTRNIPTQMF